MAESLGVRVGQVAGWNEGCCRKVMEYLAVRVKVAIGVWRGLQVVGFVVKRRLLCSATITSWRGKVLGSGRDDGTERHTERRRRGGGMGWRHGATMSTKATYSYCVYHQQYRFFYYFYLSRE